jgi:Cof subfamily protein (haloacid dehalogenase superfamily)
MKTKETIDPRRVKALALDLDGTLLLPNAVLSERARSILAKCMNRGIAVIICTGRSFGGAEPYRDALGAAGPMVYFNGAQVLDMPGGTVLELSLLDRAIAEYCVDLARSRGVYFHVFFPGTPDRPEELLAAESSGKETKIYRERTGLEPSFTDLKALFAERGSGCLKAMFIADDKILDTVKAQLGERFGDALYMVRSYVSFLEILAPGVSKGRGLLRALEFRGIGPEETIAFGDEENDLPLFGAAGFSVAPANAAEAVRGAADIVVGPNSEDGVAVFLEELFERQF